MSKCSRKYFGHLSIILFLASKTELSEIVCRTHSKNITNITTMFYSDLNAVTWIKMMDQGEVIVKCS